MPVYQYISISFAKSDVVVKQAERRVAMGYSPLSDLSNKRFWASCSQMA